ncbi:MAG: hypothetical protein ACI9ZM_003856, partial [Paracoccaceae bacterium]
DHLCVARSNFAHCQFNLCKYDQAVSKPHDATVGDAFPARHMVPS